MFMVRQSRSSFVKMMMIKFKKVTVIINMTVTMLAFILSSCAPREPNTAIENMITYMTGTCTIPIQSNFLYGDLWRTE